MKNRPLPDGIDEQALERILFPSTDKAPSRYVEPDWFLVHHGLNDPAASLAEHKERVGGLALCNTQFSPRYRRLEALAETQLRSASPCWRDSFNDHCAPTMPMIDRGTGEVRQEQILRW